MSTRWFEDSLPYEAKHPHRGKTQKHVRRRRRGDRSTHTGLALCQRVILGSVAHWWVPAGHPRYTSAHLGGEAAGCPNTLHTRHRHKRSRFITALWLPTKQETTSQSGRVIPRQKKGQNPSSQSSDHTWHAQNVPKILEPQFPLDEIQTSIKQCKREICIQSMQGVKYPPSSWQLRESEREV